MTGKKAAHTEITAQDNTGESVFNLNATQLALDEKRYLQLAFIFWYMRRHLNPDAFAELELAKADDRMYMPYRFQLAEILGIVSLNRPKMFYIEVDKDTYAEIQFDTIVVSGGQMLRLCHEALELAEREILTPALVAQEFQSTDIDWTYLDVRRAVTLRNIGDCIFCSGHIMLHLCDRDPVECKNPRTLDTCREQTEYIEIISNLEPGKFFLMVPARRQMIAGGFSIPDRKRLYDLIQGACFDAAKWQADRNREKAESQKNV